MCRVCSSFRANNRSRSFDRAIIVFFLNLRETLVFKGRQVKIFEKPSALNVELPERKVSFLFLGINLEGKIPNLALIYVKIHSSSVLNIEILNKSH